jgi:hypothetical protein
MWMLSLSRLPIRLGLGDVGFGDGRIDAEPLCFMVPLCNIYVVLTFTTILSSFVMQPTQMGKVMLFSAPFQIACQV